MKDKDMENVDLEKTEETEGKTETVGDDAGEKVSKSDRMRRLRMGGYSILLVMFVVAAAIIVNLIVGAIPKKYTQFELTGFGLYEVSDTAKELLANLDRDITVSCATRRSRRFSTATRLTATASRSFSSTRIRTPTL